MSPSTDSPVDPADPVDLSDLASYLAMNPRHSSTMYANELEELISTVDENDGYASHERFLKICDVASFSFPQGTPSNEEIKQNPATLPLMKLLLRAFRSYHLRTTKDNKLDTAERRALLAECFGLDAGKRGGNTRSKPWNIERKQELLITFARAFDGESDPQSWSKAFKKTYEVAFGDDSLSGRDHAQSMKNRRRLNLFLAEHCVNAERFQVNLKILAL